MALKKLSGLAAAVALFAGLVLGQAAPDEAAAEKQRQLIALADLTLQDIPSLKLAENRAYVYAKTGSILWRVDEKRGRSLFQNAVGELTTLAQAPTQGKEERRYRGEMGNGQGVRHQILQIIAGVSAEIALEALYKSRPTIVAEAMSADPGKAVKISQYSDGRNNHLAQAEVQLEQSFLRLAADQNPDRAASYLRESLKKGLTHQSVDLLHRLHQKDPEAARTMTADMFTRLAADRFIVNNQLDHQAYSIAHNLITRYLQSRESKDVFPTVPAAEMRSFAEKLVGAFTDSRVQQNAYYLGQAIEIADKLVPGATARLKEAYRDTSSRQNNDPNHEAINKLVNGDATPEHMIAEAKKYPMHTRGQIYETAATRLASAGNTAAARQVIEDNFADHALDNALHNLNNREFHRLQGSGNFADAERVIADLPEAQRVQMLVNLASSVFNKNREENRSQAVTVLYRARSFIGEEAENAQEMGQMLQIISAFVEIEPSSAFQMFQSITPRINEIAEASMIVNGFHNNNVVRQGELLITQSNSLGFHIDASIFTRLAEKEFDRAMQLIDSLSRREMRILFRLEIAQGSAFHNLAIINLPITARQLIITSH